MKKVFHDNLIVRCLSCGGKNRIPLNRLKDTPLCGTCGAPLDELIIQCIECGAKNRVPEHRLFEGPVCGKCGHPLYKGDLIEVTDETFETEVLAFPGPVVLCAWRPDCTSCRIVIPIIQRIAPKYGGGIKVARINIDTNPYLKKNYTIQETPSILFFRNGTCRMTLVGPASEEDIERHLQSIVRNE